MPTQLKSKQCLTAWDIANPTRTIYLNITVASPDEGAGAYYLNLGCHGGRDNSVPKPVMNACL